MKDSTMNALNEKMLEDTLNNFNAIYSIYEKNADAIKRIDAVQPFLDMQCLIGDISNAKSSLGKVALCNELAKLIDKTGASVLQMKKIVDEMGKKFIALRNKMPMPKSEVSKILRMFNFYDYGEDETTEGIYASKCQLDEYQYNGSKSSNKCIKETSKDIEKCANELKECIDGLDKNDEHIYDELSGNALDDPDVDEDDVKEITPEQFMNVVDDTKDLVNKAKKLANGEKPEKKKKQRQVKKSK